MTTGCLVLAIVGAAACGASHASSSAAAASTPAHRVEPPPCAQTRKPDAVAHNPWAQARKRLAPAGPDAMRLCRYGGLNASPPNGLVHSRLVSGRAIITRLVGQFNQLPPFPPGAFACPSDDGTQILALLAYPNGKQVTIAVSLTGCEGVTNGDVDRVANGYGSHPRVGPDLLSELERLDPK